MICSNDLKIAEFMSNAGHDCLVEVDVWVKPCEDGHNKGQAGPRNDKALLRYFRKFHLVTCLSN
jgi:hypothetical protein